MTTPCLGLNRGPLIPRRRFFRPAAGAPSEDRSFSYFSGAAFPFHTAEDRNSSITTHAQISHADENGSGVDETMSDCSRSTFDSWGDTVKCSVVGKPLTVRVLSLSGEAFLGPVRMQSTATLCNVMEAIMNLQLHSKEYMATLMFGRSMIYDLNATLNDFLGSPQDADTCNQPVDSQDADTCNQPVDFNLIWQPLFKNGDQVAVGCGFRTTARYESVFMDIGLQGKVVKIHRDASIRKTAAHIGFEKTDGDALINFDGIGNIWVRKPDLCKLRHI